MPMMLALENFVRDAGGPVSQEELKAFGMGKIFLKDFQYTQFSLKLSNVIRTADWGYLHIDNFEVDSACLESLVAYTQQVLAREGHCSIEMVYRDKRVTCRAAGIDGPVMLYSLLQCFADERLDLPGYPRVSSRTTDDIAQRYTIGQRIVAFVREHGGPCFYETLEEKLVTELGYKEGQIYSVVREPEVCTYHPGCVIHLDNLGWNEKKQSALEEAAAQSYAEAIRAGRCFARISHMLESCRLPELSADLHWSCAMIADLLAKGHRFLVIGNGREAFVPRENEAGIRVLEDVIAVLLDSQFGGATSITELETMLRESSIIRKRLTQTMLSPGRRVAMRNGEIALKELFVDA
jgi:hypothetical protein